MAKDTFEKILIHIWAEMAAGLVIVTMGYFALNPNSGVGVGLSLLGCLASVAILVYLFRDALFSKQKQKEEQIPGPSGLASGPSPPLPPPPPPLTTNKNKKADDDEDDDDDDDDDDKDDKKDNKKSNIIEAQYIP
jgi:hypothetical protein